MSSPSIRSRNYKKSRNISSQFSESEQYSTLDIESQNLKSGQKTDINLQRTINFPNLQQKVGWKEISQALLNPKKILTDSCMEQQYIFKTPTKTIINNKDDSFNISKTLSPNFRYIMRDPLLNRPILFDSFTRLNNNLKFDSRCHMFSQTKSFSSQFYQMNVSSECAIFGTSSEKTKQLNNLLVNEFKTSNGHQNSLISFKKRVIQYHLQIQIQEEEKLQEIYSEDKLDKYTYVSQSVKKRTIAKREEFFQRARAKEDLRSTKFFSEMLSSVKLKKAQTFLLESDQKFSIIQQQIDPLQQSDLRSSGNKIECQKYATGSFQSDKINEESHNFIDNLAPMIQVKEVQQSKKFKISPKRKLSGPVVLQSFRPKAQQSVTTSPQFICLTSGMKGKTIIEIIKDSTHRHQLHSQSNMIDSISTSVCQKKGNSQQICLKPLSEIFKHFKYINGKFIKNKNIPQNQIVRSSLIKNQSTSPQKRKINLISMNKIYSSYQKDIKNIVESLKKKIIKKTPLDIKIEQNI